MDDEWSIEPDPARAVEKARLRERVYRAISTHSPMDAETGEPFTRVDFMTAAVGSYDPYLEKDDVVIGWPEEDLDALPEKLRYEIEDGILTVSPRPTFEHQRIAYLANKMVEEQCPDDWWPLQDAEIRIYEDGNVKQARSPDLMVVPRKLTTAEANCCWIEPKDAVFVLEVVSGSSRISDRMTKVGLYAEWKIPLYLRIEPKPIPALYEYRLDKETGLYRTPLEHTAIFATDDPFPVRIELESLR
ncbi:Uma2 family endonuclease [Cryptosporangium sp. NPDC051539]|uniref:Uma2 family endonuclease n=1 Tax=Cryptosporangium sp. NPDC051539 TaxID=3363962 RepID=UPI0037A4214A